MSNWQQNLSVSPKLVCNSQQVLSVSPKSVCNWQQNLSVSQNWCAIVAESASQKMCNSSRIYFPKSVFNRSTICLSISVCNL
jgi:hypothetical protein